MALRCGVAHVFTDRALCDLLGLASRNSAAARISHALHLSAARVVARLLAGLRAIHDVVDLLFTAGDFVSGSLRHAGVALGRHTQHFFDAVFHRAHVGRFVVVDATAISSELLFHRGGYGLPRRLFPHLVESAERACTHPRAAVSFAHLALAHRSAFFEARKQRACSSYVRLPLRVRLLTTNQRASLVADGFLLHARSVLAHEATLSKRLPADVRRNRSSAPRRAGEAHLRREGEPGRRAEARRFEALHVVLTATAGCSRSCRPD